MGPAHWMRGVLLAAGRAAAARRCAADGDDDGDRGPPGGQHPLSGGVPVANLYRLGEQVWGSTERFSSILK